MCTSGLWRGYLAHDDARRVGTFKFINVALVPLETGAPGLSHPYRGYPPRHGTLSNPASGHKHRPKTLEQLLRTIDMEVSL